MLLDQPFTRAYSCRPVLSTSKCTGGADTQGRRSGDHGQSCQPQAAAIRQAIRGAGARLFLLPKYSPDLNPIEQVFAKLKHLLRKAAARTRQAVCAAIGDLLGSYTSDECAAASHMCWRCVPITTCVF